MLRSRPPSLPTDGSPRLGHLLSRTGSPAETRPGRRPATALRLTVAVGLCTLVASAISVPSLVLGAEGSGAQNAAAAVQRHSDAPSTGMLLVTLPWGDGAGQVGLVRPVEGLTRGPEALAVAPDGRIAVLDSVNQRVLFLDAEGRCTGCAAVSLAEPRFLAVDDDRLYVLDCDADRQVVTLDWTGAPLSAASLPELPDVVTGLFATPEGPCVEVAHDSSFLVAAPLVASAELESDGSADERGASPAHASLRALAGRPVDPHLDRVVKVSYAPGQKARIRVFTVDKSTLESTERADFKQPLAPGHDLEHLVSVDGDGDGGLIVGARLLDPGPKDDGHASLVLTRLAARKNGARAVDGLAEVRVSDMLLLADSPYAYLGQPYAVAPDGRVLQPIGSDSGYSIFVHTFAAADTSNVATEVQP
jgi:hypothetical protein